MSILVHHKMSALHVGILTEVCDLGQSCFFFLCVAVAQNRKSLWDMRNEDR